LNYFNDFFELVKTHISNGDNDGAPQAMLLFHDSALKFAAWVW
jgi:hypothetical protein